MAQTIKLKRSATQGATPTTSQLELGEVAINTYDGKMYIKKSVGGTESIVEITGGSGTTAADAILVEYQYTATSSQTTFSGSDDNSETLSYTADAIQVFLNGVLLDPAIDYTATNGTSVVLSSAATTGDYLQIFAFKKRIADGNVSVDTFTGNNSTTAFTLSVNPGDENNTRVFIDGVYQSKSNYSVSGTTLTFSTAPPTDTAIEVEIGNRAVTLDTASSINLLDNSKLQLGTSQDLEVFHNGTDSVINQTGTGDLLIQKDETTVAEFDVDGLTVTGDVEVTGEIIGDLRGATLFKAQAGEALTKGEVVYISGVSGNTTVVSKADADDASKMPAFGLVAASASSGNPVDIYTAGILADIDTSSFSEGDELFVSTTAGALTATAPAGESAALQKIGKVTRSDATGGRIFIIGAGRTNAVPNLDNGDIFIGNASNQAVSASLNTKIEDYLDGGTSTPTFAGLATTANMTFGDNDKAIFGAGSDLQIYHDGLNSYIKDSGTGRLYIQSASDFLIANTANTQNYIYAVESGAVNLYYSGSKKFETTSTGIDVTGQVKATSDFIAADSGGVARGYLFGTSSGLFARFNSGGTFQVQEGGSTKLTVNSTGIDVTGTVTLDNTLNISGGSTAGFVQASGTLFQVGASTASDLVAYTNNAERMRINSSGKVGIGTTAPSGKLTIADTNNTTARGNLHIFTTDTAAADVGGSLTLGGKYSGDFEVGFGGISGRYNGSGVGGYLAFNTLNSSGTAFPEHMRIDSSGNVGIGTTSPGYLVDAQSSGDAAIRIRSTGTSASDDSLLRMQIAGTTASNIIAFGDSDSSFSGEIRYTHNNNSMSFDTNGTEAMRIDSSGRLLVGGTSTGSNVTMIDAGRISVDKSADWNIESGYGGSTSSAHIRILHGGTQVGSITSTASATAYNVSSDQRLKDNIVDAPSASDDIDAIQVRSFDWKADGSHQKYGMVAQELKGVVPDAVTEGETEEDMMSVDYSKLVPMLVKALQESRQEINNLKSRVEELESQ